MLLTTQPQKNFLPYLLLFHQILVRNKEHPRWRKIWFQAQLGLGVSQMEKSDGYMHVFMFSQASDSSADFSWRHMQIEVEIRQNRK